MHSKQSLPRVLSLSFSILLHKQSGQPVLLNAPDGDQSISRLLHGRPFLVGKQKVEPSFDRLLATR